jgi:putative hydrolase of the HAD superfamily
MPLPLQAVLFDLDDTLHDDTRAYRVAAERVSGEMALEYGIEPERLTAAYISQADNFWQGLTPSVFGTPLLGLRTQMWAAALASVGLVDPALALRCADAYHRNRRDILELFPGAALLLARLRERGYKLGLITNGFADTHREKITLLALEQSFDEILIADEVGLLKPDPRIFLLAAERLGVPAAACAMVGDRFERDITGAQAAGMFAVWMNVRGERMPAGAVAPDATVRGVGDVEAALRLPEYV